MPPRASRPPTLYSAKSAEPLRPCLAARKEALCCGTRRIGCRPAQHGLRAMAARRTEKTTTTARLMKNETSSATLASIAKYLFASAIFERLHRGRFRRRSGRGAQSRCRCGWGESPVPAQMRHEVSPVPPQIWQGRARSRCRCGRGEPSPGADVGRGEPRGEPSPGADVAWVEPGPGADVSGVSPVPAQMWRLCNL
jgi:hypothetical protein